MKSFLPPQIIPADYRSSDVFVCDFDGVLCDSAAEMAVSAWRAGGRIWPKWKDPEPPADYAAGFLRLRPLLEKGYEAVCLMRLIANNVPDESIQLNFTELCDGICRGIGRTAGDMARIFGRVRDEWIGHDPDKWVGMHAFYPKVIETFADKATTVPVFILTTKQERFIRVLLESRGIALPADRILGLDRGKSKEDLLKDLSCIPEFEGAEIHFVEDRLNTLLRVTKRPDLSHVRLYLADWGYNTAADREFARLDPRITVWDSGSFLGDERNLIKDEHRPSNIEYRTSK